ncbi:MAG: cell division protein FtsA, partial [Thermotogae bacterium]
MIFALDVGTGKIAGLISFMERNILKIVDVQIVEHESRVMFDGQIHDVNLVAEEVLSVKKALEERNETNLKEVAIALAGRYLKTIVGEAEKDLSRVSSITREDVLRLEIEALKDANSKLENEDLYCVGYSVFEYKLDGAWMKKLEGHKGGKAYVKIVSAFLPVHVVESM